jgi:ABC-type phosphate/phosphonate transport system substrate-binding protein
MIAALPMYDADPAAVEALWQAIAGRLRLAGLSDVPSALQWPGDLSSHWLEPEVLLSQTCGYPLTHELDRRVQLVGAFRYSAEGCVGTGYSSRLVVRAADAGQVLAAFKDRRLAANAFHSQSGYHSLRPSMTALGTTIDAFFGSVSFTGAHKHSIEWVRNGEADIAAIDCVTLTALKQADANLMDGLAVIGDTAVTPGLPLITSLRTSPDDVRRLRVALQETMLDPALATLRQHLYIDGFEQVDVSAYEATDRL